MAVISAETQGPNSDVALTLSQLRILTLLRCGSRLPSELARELGVTPATTSEVIDLLVRRGLVTRGDRAPEGDRRTTPLAITTAGRERLEAGRARTLAALDAIIQRLDASERAAIATALDILLRSMPRGKGGRGERP